MAKGSKLTEGDIAFQEIGLENKESIGVSTKPISSKSFSTMRPNENIPGKEKDKVILGDRQSDNMYLEKDYSNTPGSFSMEQQVPGELINQVSCPKKVSLERNLKDRTGINENKEAFFEKKFGLNPNEDEDLFWNSIDDLLISDEVDMIEKYLDLHKSHLFSPEQNLALGTKRLAENLEKDLYHSLRNTVNDWYSGIDSTTNSDDALLSLRKQLIRWSQDISSGTINGLHDIIDLGVKAGIRKSRIPVPLKFYNQVNVTSFSQKGIMPAIRNFSDEVFRKASNAASKHNMGSYRQKRAIDSELRKMRDRTRLMLKTETARFANLGMLEAFNQDPEKYLYKYYWHNTLDDRTKNISKMRVEGNPYSMPEMLWLWKKQEQFIDGRWENDTFNQRCSFYRGERLEKEWSNNRFEGKEYMFRESM